MRNGCVCEVWLCVYVGGMGVCMGKCEVRVKEYFSVLSQLLPGISGYVSSCGVKIGQWGEGHMSYALAAFRKCFQCIIKS